jgi:hypothetical protein
MGSGKKDELRLANSEIDEIVNHLQFARWLLQNHQVVEVWSVHSDLAEIVTPQTALTLDAGTWFLCRVELPPIQEEHGIISFIRESHSRGQSTSE